MPIFVDSDRFGSQPPNWTSGPDKQPEARFAELNSHCLNIGLVNNMPDKALQSTARQFARLLDAASDGIAVRLSLYALPDVPRSEFGRHQINTRYLNIEALWHRPLDGLIVTGTEPKTANLTAEPYWASLTKVLDWADSNTHSTILSCLSAHAGVFHFDGIRRRRLNDKCFGLFESYRDSEHFLTSLAPLQFSMPQSRWNDLPENELTGAGYAAITRLQRAGIDAFIKQRNSMFVFFQGHPEYGSDTLYLEYRRDVGRYLRREKEDYPSAPVGYFNAATTERFGAFQRRALFNRRETLLSEFPAADVDTKLWSTWNSVGTCVYRNWLEYLRARKERRLATSKEHVNAHSSKAAL